MSTYRVGSILLTVQAEGTHAGMRAVVVALAAGDQPHTPMAVREIANTVGDLLTRDGAADEGGGWALITGERSAAQVDQALVEALHARRVRVRVETDGTVPLPRAVDWVSVVRDEASGGTVVVPRANELRAAWPGAHGALVLDALAAAGRYTHLYVVPGKPEHLEACREYVIGHPRWRVAARVQAG